MGGLDSYLALPSAGSAKIGILMITDVFGWKVKNARLFTDRLAKAGYVAVRACVEIVSDVVKGLDCTPFWPELDHQGCMEELEER